MDILTQTIQESIKRFVSPDALILNVTHTPMKYGLSGSDLQRHKVQLQVENNESSISLVTKKAKRNERLVLKHLYEQNANVPYHFSFEGVDESTVLLCMQDIDCNTDYSQLNLTLLERREMEALSFIHSRNYQQEQALNWFPLLSMEELRTILNPKWIHSWNEAKKDEAFLARYGQQVGEVEHVWKAVERDLPSLIESTSSQTLIHHDLHPGNVLVFENKDVYYIDWEDARLGPLYIDIALRYHTLEKAEQYREQLYKHNLEFKTSEYHMYYKIARRYNGIKYLPWFLQNWKVDQKWQDELDKYVAMVIQ